MDIFIPLINVITATVILTTPVQPVTPTYLLPAMAIGVPLQTTPGAADARPAEIPDGVAWLNWTARCVDRWQWPMVYSHSSPEPVGCDNHIMLIGNEGEYTWQANDTPAEMAETLHTYRDHPAGLYCCGSYYDERGFWYTLAVFGEYWYRYNAPPPIIGLHFHAYRHVTAPWDYAALDRWRMLSEWFGLPIVLSEWAVEGRSQEATAAAMEANLRELQDALGGRVWIAFWFSWNYTGYELTDARRDGDWTAVGREFIHLVGLAGR
jgi:hypothetical protein